MIEQLRELDILHKYFDRKLPENFLPLSRKFGPKLIAI